MSKMPKLTGIAGIRARMAYPKGWYWTTKQVDAIGISALDDLEVCLEKIDELEKQVTELEAQLHKDDQRDSKK